MQYCNCLRLCKPPYDLREFLRQHPMAFAGQMHTVDRIKFSVGGGVQEVCVLTLGDLRVIPRKLDRKSVV